MTKLKRAVDVMETDVQDLLQEKDTQIASLDATVRALEQEGHMARTRMMQAEEAIADERDRCAALERAFLSLDTLRPAALLHCRCRHPLSGWNAISNSQAHVMHRAT